MDYIYCNIFINIIKSILWKSCMDCNMKVANYLITLYCPRLAYIGPFLIKLLFVSHSSSLYLCILSSDASIKLNSCIPMCSEKSNVFGLFWFDSKKMQGFVHIFYLRRKRRKVLKSIYFLNNGRLYCNILYVWLGFVSRM